MLRSYIKIALRQLRHQNIYSLVNLFGITLSITSSILLFLYLRNEFSFDNYNTQTPVYRIASKAIINGNTITSPTSPAALGPSLKGVVSCRISTQPGIPLGIGAKLFNEKDIYAVDPSFFELFPLNLVSVEIDPLLDENTIILTQSLALKLFNYENPIGEKIRFGKSYKVVSGIVEDPLYSHLNFSGLILHNPDKQWITFSDYTYIKTNKTVVEINDQIELIYKESMEPFFSASNSSCTFFLQPLEEIYLESHLQGELGINGNKSIDIALIIIGFFMLIIAGINYTNMSTARTIKRSKEIAIRKAIGSYRRELIWQFIVESILLVFFGVFLSLIVIDKLIPYVHFITDTHIYDISIFDWQLLIFISVVVAGIGLMGSVYPVFYMTKFTVAETLAGNIHNPGNKLTKRRILLFIQFTISILLIICTWAINRQINYVNNKDLGYNPTHIMTIKLPDYTPESRGNFISEVARLEYVVSAGTSNLIPGDEKETLTSFYFFKEDDIKPEQVLVKYFYADEKFTSALEIEILEGSGLAGGRQKNEIIINEALLRQLQPVGNVINMTVRLPFNLPGGTSEAKIVGVTKNAHFKSLHQKVQPVVIMYKPINTMVLIRFSQDKNPDIAAIEKLFSAQFPYFPFEFHFLEDQINNLYRQDILTSRLFGIFAIITTSLSLMGIFALSFYTSEIRKKEIGIRKINGASIREILYVINREYLVIVGLAGLIAWPAAYLILGQWLKGFEYKVEPGAYVFIVSMVFSIIISLATVSINTVRAAKTKIVATLNQG